jgi:hypothetical protein
MSKELKGLAAQECCNYTTVGARDIRNYCYMEPKDTEFRCRIFCGLPCGWFAKAVLPLKPEFVGFYRSLLDSDKSSDCHESSIELQTKTCSCGKDFVAKSNRQTECPECHKKHVREVSRERQRRHRNIK